MKKNQKFIPGPRRMKYIPTALKHGDANTDPEGDLPEALNGRLDF